MPRRVVLWALLGLSFLPGCPAAQRQTQNPGKSPEPAVASARDAGAESSPPPAANPPPETWDFAGGRQQHGQNACDPAIDTVRQTEAEILRGDAPRTQAASREWDKKSEPQYLGRLKQRFALNRAEQRLLAKNGFVVPARLKTPGYTRAFHELYQSQLPIYVSVDAIFHAVFKSHEQVVVGLELMLAARERKMLDAMHGALPRLAPELPSDVARDVDVYLTVARSLLADATVESALGTDKEAAPLIESARRAEKMKTVQLFGRARVVDFSQFAPRGYYASAESGALIPYFRASMWLSRLELNLSSRASRSSQPGLAPNPAETPREAVVALALARLAERARVLPDLDALDAAWTSLGGRREDVSVGDLLALTKKARIGRLEVPAAADSLRANIGNDFQRTARIHYMPQGSWPLPAIATLLGPRILPDTAPLSHVVHQDINGRDLPTFADVAFLLGHDRAERYLDGDFRHYRGLKAALKSGRAAVAKDPAPGMFGAWLTAISKLAGRPEGTLPGFMRTDAFSDARIASTVAAYGQLRHGAVLVAGQPYSEGGCEVPDGYVDPVPAVYGALGQYARRGVTLSKLAQDESAEAHFTRLGEVLRLLGLIAKDELAGRELSDAQKRWLSMVVEIQPPTSDSPGSFDGWYFDLFPSVEAAFAEASFAADWFTGSNTHNAAVAGAKEPRLGLFVVDRYGPPRAFVGPVASAYAVVVPLEKRASATDGAAPWERSYVAPAPTAPALQVVTLDIDYSGDVPTHRFAVRSPVGARVRIDLLDHHRMIVGTITARATGSFRVVAVPAAKDSFAERFRVAAGAFSAEAASMEMGGTGAVAAGGLPEIDFERLYELRNRFPAAP